MTPSDPTNVDSGAAGAAGGRSSRNGGKSGPSSLPVSPKPIRSKAGTGSPLIRLLSGFLVVVMLALAVAACSSESASPTPTGTPESTATAQSAETQAAQVQATQQTAQPTPTPTPTPSPTPTLPPEPDFGKAEIEDPDPGNTVESVEYGEVIVNQVGVILSEGKTRADAERIAAIYGGKVIGEIEFMNMYQLEVEAATEDELIGILDGVTLTDGVEVAFPNTRAYPLDSDCKACGPLSDPVYGEGENGRAYEIIGVQSAWGIIKASGIKLNNVHVGVMDTALYKGSDEVSGASAVSGDTTEDPATDDAGNIEDGGLNHGTMVTHVIAANPENGGVAGVAGNLGDKLKVSVTNMYKNVPKYVESNPDPEDPTKMVWTNGKTYTCQTFVDMIKQIEDGATVINCSFGPDHPDPANKPVSDAYHKFLQAVYKKYPDVIFVAAAGNENGGLDGSNYSIGGHKLPNLITVGAIDNKGNRAGFSNYATGDGEVTISAPGVKVAMGVGPDGKTVKASGTSFATPQVAAAAVMIRSINPKLSAAEIKKILEETATPGVPGETESVLIPEGMGAGVLAVDQAVLKVINDLRKAEGKPALDGEKLKKLATIEGSAETESATEFTVSAVLEEVGDSGADVSIALLGEGSIGGSSKQHLDKAGEVTWSVSTIEGKPAPSLRLCRLDTDACCDLSLEAIDLDGHWEGTMTIIDANVVGDVSIPDPFGEGPPTVITKEECEAALKEGSGEPQPLAMDFMADTPTSGVVIMGGGESGSGGDDQTPIPYTFDGRTVVMDMSEEGATIHIEGTVRVAGDSYVMEGTMIVNMHDEESLVMSITMSFSVSKPKPKPE